MEQYYTQEGDRKDLAVNLNPPENYIGYKLMPIVEVGQKSGTVYFMDVDTVANSASQTNRASGSAPSPTLLADSSTSYTCGERIKRAAVDVTEAKQITVAGADKAGVRWAARQVWNAHEAEVAALIMDQDPDDTFTASTFVQDVQTALDSMRNIEGRTALVASTQTFRWICQNSTVAAMILRIVTGNAPGEAVQGLSLQQSTYAMAILLGVDDILLGSEELWGDEAGYGRRFAIVKYDASGDALSQKAAPIFGKTIAYLDEQGAGGIFGVSATADRVNLRNLYDCVAWWDAVQFNSEAVYLFSEADGRSESSTSQSSESSSS